MACEPQPQGPNLVFIHSRVPKTWPAKGLKPGLLALTDHGVFRQERLVSPYAPGGGSLESLGLLNSHLSPSRGSYPKFQSPAPVQCPNFLIRIQ